MNEQKTIDRTISLNRADVYRWDGQLITVDSIHSPRWIRFFTKDSINRMKARDEIERLIDEGRMIYIGNWYTDDKERLLDQWLKEVE